MGTKLVILLGLSLAVFLMISSEVIASRELAETTTTPTEAEKANAVAEDKNQDGYGGGYGGHGGHGGGGYGGGGYGGGGHGGGGYGGGGYGGGGHGGGGYGGGGHGGGGYGGGGHGGGGYGGGGGCHYGCCSRGYYGGCKRCCSYKGEAVDAAKP